MNYFKLLVDYAVFVLPTAAIAYIIIGIRLYQQHPEKKYRYFSGFMFSAACYAMGYFLALNANDESLFRGFRSLAYLGAIFVPSFGILFVVTFTGLKKFRGLDLLLLSASFLWWLLYLTNPLHHLVYIKLEMVAAGNFSIAATQKNWGYYLIFLYFILFLIFTMWILFKKMRTAKLNREKRNFRFLFMIMQMSWIGILIILIGWDTYFDPAAVIILIISALMGINEVRNDLLDLSVSRWKKTVTGIEEMALLIEGNFEIVAQNRQAEILLAHFPDQKKLIQMLKGGNESLMLDIDSQEYHLSISHTVFNEFRAFDSYILEDQTKKLKAELALKESEEMHRLLVTQMTQGLVVIEVCVKPSGYDLICLDINPSFEAATGCDKNELLGRSVLKIVKIHYPEIEEMIFMVALTGQQKKTEIFFKRLGKYFDLFFYAPRKNECAIVTTDISERKSDEQAIRYISYHDHLTGLYNRRYFEEELRRLDQLASLPISLIMADVNGLKLINDSLGHQMGDQLLKMAAEIIETGRTDEGFATRLGGDEFMLVLPRTDEMKAAKIIENLRGISSSRDVENSHVSISFGRGTKTKPEEEILTIYRQAENDMYQQKLYESSSVKNKTIHLIMNMLFEKSNREMRHSERVSQLSTLIGTKLDLSPDRVSQIGLAGLMHDIGKMGIEEWILNKKGSLNKEEYEAMKKHPEIGYRILRASEEFEKIAGFVLEHHERWDGLGYPRRLKGEEISLEARIIGVADAYDAMTCDRSYRTGLLKEAAVKEIETGSGSQFDPKIAAVFVSKVLPELLD
ncbi:diguanylate cyclase [Eubacteriaceae bacterium ES2]|nr:diguanylate cyclase [Eubacteriaceae bacterium ES2]